MNVPLSWGRVFTARTFDVPAVVFVLVLGAGYLAAAHRMPGWPRGRRAAFLAGLATILLMTCSFLGVYDDELFWARAVQVVVFLMVTPLLLALGAPLTLVLATAPFADRLRKLGRGTFARALTFPLVITVLLIIPPFAIYLTPLYELTLRHGAVDEIVRLGVLCCGFVYFWTRLRVDPTPREDHHLVSFGVSLTEVILDAALGLVLWLGPLRAADYYHALARAWGPDPHTDQIIGAGILWIGGDVAGLPFVGALFTRWMRDDDRQAKRIDRELDEREEKGEAPSGLWWENDPQLAERFRRR
ncbi:cytochrome c oxidase assembly protein [Amycolatopsis alkalitolerans]|uniref:Cytochrome c oxidase assembly protein n=1 Tax=Amycolatopsis alkalitolerans TaxID=2547244 RepID=A0A5C4LVL0_9PSEU|nr:cytochrome c oxidase assembly protein [Amycolatopsis alkalitolerans]TNC23136.1 cytochrome c oxidase assembly protein [Amycolatopsis alkalitolerans]